MIRQFQFEDEVHQNLGCVPMAVRRKLDRIGLKVSLAQWQALSLGERLAACHLPVASADECEALRTFLDEAVRARSGASAKPLPEAARGDADPPAAPPPLLITNARAEGVELDQSRWDGLDADQRYALLKLGAGPQCSHNFGAALREFFNP
jgi:hypothetical protein